MSDGVELREWRDLPSECVAAAFSHAKNKRSAGRLVCGSWRRAINKYVDTLQMPAHELHLLSSYPCLRHLTVVGGGGQTHMNAASTGVHAATAAAAAAAQEQHGVVTTERSSSRSSTQASPVLALPQLLSLRLLSCHGMGAQLLAAARQLTSLTSLVVVAAPGGSSSSTADTTNFSNSSSSSQACRGGSMLQGMQRLSPSSKPGSSSGGSSSTGAPQLEQGALLDGTTTGGWLHGTLQQLPHLQHLVLEHLPSSCVNPLTGLTALRQLALRGCGLRDLPPGVAAALTRVTQLDLSSNLLLQPPMSLAVLPQLEDLDLSHNLHLTWASPGPWAALTALTALALAAVPCCWAAPAAPVPPAAGDAEVALVGQGPAAAGPAHLHQQAQPAAGGGPGGPAAAGPAAGDAPHLPAAAGGGEDVLGAVPARHQDGLLPELGHLLALKRLSLRGNITLLVLPTALRACTGLQDLDVGASCLRWLDVEVLLGAAASLTRLDLADTSLAEVPEGIAGLTGLQELDLSRCRHLWQLPGALSQLAALSRLWLPSKALNQHLVESLELRDPTPVEVVLDDSEEEEDMEGGLEDWCTSEEEEEEEGGMVGADGEAGVA